MDDNRLDAIAYPTTRRIAPLVGSKQTGSNAGLSAQTGFPAITVLSGYTLGGFPSRGTKPAAAELLRPLS